MNRTVLLFMLLLLLGGCATREAPNPAFYQIDPGNLPEADVSLNIPGLGPCTDNPDRTLHLNSHQPVNVLTHGCFGSSGQFRGLAQVLAFQGQQTACFTYDDRDHLEKSAISLRRAVNQLAKQTSVPLITVIGHSQGALISRKAMTELPVAPPSRDVRLRLVTISGPFSGIESAKTCGRDWLMWASLGIVPLSCYVVTGPKWEDITYSSSFILQPGKLIPEVGSYLKIDTDEEGTCRREQDGRCLESDFVFSETEQRNARVEADARADRVEVRAGHVEIVGDKREAPTKLIAILQQHGVIRPTAPGKLSAFNQMLARVYHDAALLKRDDLHGGVQP